MSQTIVSDNLFNQKNKEHGAELLMIAGTLTKTVTEILENVDSDVAPELIQPVIGAIQQLNYLAGKLHGGECNLCEECYEKFYGEAPNSRTNSTL